MGRKFFLKEITHLGGVILSSSSIDFNWKIFLWGQVIFAFYMLLMSSFSVVDAKGGEIIGTKAMKIVSNTKHHQIKILILQVGLALWSKIGSKWIMELGGGLSP
jgi:hypothetical protein